MKTSKTSVKIGRSHLTLLVALLCGLMVAPSPSRAKLQATITVTNNSSREIAHLYTSPTDRKEWSADQLPEGTKLQTAGSFTLTNVICENDQIKVIAEDKDGCFMYAATTCNEGAIWIITDSTSRDCGN
jgi:hypothetical protein